MKIIILIFCLFILIFQNVRASEDDEAKTTVPEWQLGRHILSGKILEYNPLMAPIIGRPVIGGEIFISRQTYGAHSWNAFFNYPEYGISYTFLDLGSPNYVGMAHCLFPYLNFHFFNNQNHLNLHFRVGTGLAYVEKIYNAENNPLNQASSTHLNAVLNAQLQGVCKIDDRWSVFAGGGLLHISNGAYQLPNLGLNIANLFTGISYSFGKENKLIVPESKINEKNRNWDCSVLLSAGVKEINPIGGNKYFAGDFNVEVTKKHLQYTRFGLSLDITYDASEYNCIIFQSLPAVNRLNTTRIGVSGGYVLLFGDLSLNTYLGVYLHEANPLYGRIYQRTSLRYPLSDRLNLVITLRNHKGKADYVGFGFAYRLTK